jgi:Phosphotransferase enzyme family
MRAAHGWLPAVVPTRARRFRVEDAELAAALAEAGAELVESAAEVEIAPAGAEIQGEAELAIVTVVGPESRAGPPLVRAARRAAHSLRARLEAARARRALRRRGYADVSVLRWDLPDRVRLPGLTADGPRLPRYALVVGRRRAREPTAVESALETAAEPGAGVSWASTRAGLVVLAVNGSLLRVAIGPTRAEIDNGAAALEALRAASPPSEVADRVPWPLSRGRVGLADWSLERLLTGTQPSRSVPEPLLGDCLGFLQALGRLRGAPADTHALPALAGAVEEVCLPETARELRAVAVRLERRLAEVPRCFAHGDFFAGNLLADDGGRLSGVVDWDAAGSGRLPLLDLLHLQLTRSGPFADQDWGRTLLAQLLPPARAGGDEPVRRYCREVGLDLDPSLLEALVFAYWLDYTAYQLRAHPVRRAQPGWIEGNVELVVRSAAGALAD